jgi:hypothetical protein
MAKHKARSIRASAVTALFFAAVAALFAAMVGQSSAGAATLAPPPGKSVTMKNADVLAKCSFTVNKVNPSDGTIVAKVAAQAQPASLFGYFNNVYTQVFCSVSDPIGNVLTKFNPIANGGVLPAQSETPVLPYSSSYIVCGQALVKKNNGSQSLTPLVCA